MPRNYLEQCPCGSGEFSQAVYDNHGIFVDFMCDVCREKKMAKYDPVIFNDYDAYEEKVAMNGERFEEDY